MTGEGDGEGAAFANRAADMERTAVLVHNISNDGQAQTAATGFAGAGLVYPVESLKNMGQGIFRDTHAGVRHRENDGIFFAAKGDMKRAAGVVVF